MGIWYTGSEVGNTRKAMPYNLSILGVIGIVNALAKLYNFCISESEILAEALAKDVNNI